MAYMNQDLKKKLAVGIKAVLKEYGIKATLSVRHHSTLVIKLKEGDISFKDAEGNDRGVNPYWVESHFKHNPRAVAFLTALLEAANEGNHDNSDIMTDYFDVGWYVDVDTYNYKEVV